MSHYGKINLLGMLALPVVATLAALIMFGPRVDTMVAVFGMNVIPMLIGGLFSSLLLRSANKAGGAGSYIALWPTLVPAAIGIVWYLWEALIPAEIAPGRVFIAGPIYSVGLACMAAIAAWIASVVVRSRQASG